jgi:hypothetical protein
MSAMITVGPKKMVAMRYIMKNAQGDILGNIMENEPVRFLVGAGTILPALEEKLTGLRIGDRKNFSINPETIAELTSTYSFDVVIDDIRWATRSELRAKEARVGKPDKDCGPGCFC